MTGLDWIIITVYLICVATVLLRAFASLLVEKVTIKLDRQSLIEQLQEQNLHDRIALKFLLEEKYDLDQLREINFSIENKGDRLTLYLDWDYSALIDSEGRSQRLVRLPPGTTFDLLPSQVFSAIPPGKTLKEKFTAESSLKRDSENGPLRPAIPMVNLVKLKPQPKQQVSPSEPLPNVTFYLRLAVRLGTGETNLRNTPLYPIDCQFTAKTLPWMANIPWNKQKYA